MGRNDDPDRELVILSKQGDSAAFGELIRRHYSFVYGIAFGVVHERQMALDIAQELFMKLQTDLKRFELKSKFRTWLYRIAYNASIDQTRKIRPHEVIETGEVDLEDGPSGVVLSDPSEGARGAVLNEEMKDQIQKALGYLSPEQRTILLLRHWEELSYEDIAESLGLELGTVMSRLHYARKKLAEILKKDLSRP